MSKNWLSFKKQEDGTHLFNEDGLKIYWNDDGLLKCEKNGNLVFEQKYSSPTKAMLNATKVYERFK